MTTYALVVGVVVLLGLGWAAVALLAERREQAEAWRRIAEERRWNWEHRRTKR